MKRKCLHASPCPVARALDSIGDWWTLLILRDAFDGLKRFNAIQKSLGIPRNILTARLRLLVDRDILGVAPASDGSVYQEYVLTDKGRDLIPVISALRQWGEQHALAPQAPADAAVAMAGALLQPPPRRADLGRFVEPPDPHTKH
ncbi:winged helix-turn-helix transcriptional regulator [Bordetella flabilis]|uniref:Transcriptional regulator n=1 Tax=Bordetella flabilis TaxID=463014 RepID=A0A193GBZ0_9BORD|nr:helix-turn-helix domain-containing protein [Bordetella flabilis]ANN76981.1 transcriptional regulator [Bordetella flabilis]